MSLTTNEIVLRLILSILFSGLIGFEREKSNSNAGIKTHVLVGMGATIVALIQVETIIIVEALNNQNVSVDAVRLIAQVVSGIGFLGAGTIIVTKRNVIGLTTAASIWGIASIGLALGMGYYKISVIGSILILTVLIFFKRIWRVQGSEYVLIKYIAKEGTLQNITESLLSIGLNFETVRWSTSPFGHDLITTQVFKIDTHFHPIFDDITYELSKISNIVSIETTNIG